MPAWGPPPNYSLRVRRVPGRRRVWRRREELAAQLATVSQQMTRLAVEARVAETQKESRQANYKVHEWSPDLTGKIGNVKSFPDTLIAGDQPLPGEGATSNAALRLQSAYSYASHVKPRPRCCRCVAWCGQRAPQGATRARIHGRCTRR